MSHGSRLATLAKIAVAIVLLPFVLGFAYFVVYPRVDEAICYARVGWRLGSGGTWEDTAAYFKRVLVVGLTPDQVHQIVGRAGEIEVHRTDLPDGEDAVRREGIHLNVCSWAPNNMGISVWYSEDWTLLETQFIRPSW